jgi:hypothetical protein
MGALAVLEVALYPLLERRREDTCSYILMSQNEKAHALKRKLNDTESQR